jgi:hypothetical protein
MPKMYYAKKDDMPTDSWNLPSVVEEDGKYYARVYMDLSRWTHKPTMKSLWMAGFSWIFGRTDRDYHYVLVTWIEVPYTLYHAMKTYPGVLPKQKGEVYER